MKGGGGGAFGRTGPDQRRPSGNRRDNFSYSSAAGGGRPPHEYGRGGPGSGGGRNETIPARPVHDSWERDRSRERGEPGGPSWDQRERDRHRSGRGAAGGAEFGSDPLATAATAAMTSTGHAGGGESSAAVSYEYAGTTTSSGRNANANVNSNNYGPVDTFGRALQPSALSTSSSRASLGRSSSAAAAAAVNHTTDYLQSRSGRGGGKGGGGRDLPWKRDIGTSASGANRPHTTPPLPAGGLPRAKLAAAAAPRTHQSHQQQPPSSKDYLDYRHSVEKRSSRSGGGGAGGGGAAGNATQAAASAANLEKLKAFTAGNARTGDPTASAVALAAAAKSTTVSNTSSTTGPSTAAPGDIGGASAKNAPLPDMKVAARKRQPTRNEMLRNAAKMKNKGQSKIQSVVSVATSLVSKKATKAKHPPPGGSVAVSAARANAASTNRLLSATIDKPSMKMLMARKLSAPEALAGDGGQYSTSSAAGSPKGKMEIQKQPAQQAPSNKPPAKRVGRAAAAMSKENHTMAHQHAGPVEICAVGKQQHIGRILPTASIAPKFVEDTLVKLPVPGEGKGSKSAKVKAKPGTGKAKVANKVAAKAKAIKEQAIGKARALTRPRAAAVSKSASAGSSSPRRKIPVPPSQQASEKEKIGPGNATKSASGKASFSRLEEAKAELEAKKRQQSMLENKGQESGAVSSVTRDDVAAIHAAEDKAKSTDEKKSEVVAGVSENGIGNLSRQHASSSSVPSKGDDDGPEEKKDDEPVGGATSKSVEAPEVVLVDRVMQKDQLSTVKAASKDNDNAAISIDSDSAKVNKNDDVMSIGDSTDEDEKDNVSKKTSQKKSSPNNNSVIVIGSSGSSAAASSSSSDVVCMDDKRGGAETEKRGIWVCDICHIAEFSEEEDAVAHEKTCTGQQSAANEITTATAKTENTTPNATDAAKPSDVPVAPETLAGPNGAADGKDGDYDSSDDERSLTMKPISRTTFESSQSSSEGDGRSDIPATIDVKAPSSPRPYEKPMQTPTTLASDASDKDADGIPAHKGTNPPRLSTKAKSSPLKDHYVGTSERLAMKASLEAKNGATKRRLVAGQTAAAGVLVDDSKKKQRRLSSSYENKKKKAPKLPPLSPLIRREPDELILMEAVPHLTRTELDGATGKPMHFITVYSSSMDILYDFKVSIRQSQIPNSGYGAFLTYLGARLLNEERRGRTWDVLDNSSQAVPKQLEATFRRTKPIFPDSHRATVTIKGENVDEYGEGECWADTEDDLFAVMKGSKNEVKIKLTDNKGELHDNGQDLLASRNLKPGETPIGFRNFHKEAHYERVPIPFCSHYVGCGLIDLGRYGPFRISDRKTELEFGIKDFIFEHEPSGWMFGVDAPLRGEDQTIDITDDRTGETHICAQEHIPMYVNEVGHNKALVQNVLPREITGKEVHYFLHLKDPLYEGQEVELLTDYLKPYEPMRERKGYGKANINKGVKADYDCVKTRTLRNLCERYFMDDTIESLNGLEVIHSLRFIDEKILKPVVTSTEWYIDKAKTAADYVNSHGFGQRIPQTKPPSRQWIARRRMHWFHGRYKDKVLELRKNNEMSEKDAEEAEAIIERMRWADLTSIFPFMNDIKIWSGKRLGKGVLIELQEELYYMASKDLCGLFEASLWCLCAETLAHDVSFVLACVPLANKTPTMGTDLAKKVMEEAEKKGNVIKKICEAIAKKHNTLEQREKMCKHLDFQSKPRATGNSKQTPSFDRLHRLFELDIGKVGRKTKSVIITMPSSSDEDKGSSDAGVDVTANQEITADPVVNGAKLGVSVGTAATANSPKKSEARDAADFPDGSIAPNATWYLQFQVVYVIDSLARSFDEMWSRDSGGEKFNWYSLESLCNRLDLNYEQTKAVLEHTRAKASTIDQFTTQTAGDDDDDNERDGSPGYTTPKKRAQRQPKKGNSRTPSSTSTSGNQKPKSNKKLFNGTIWKTLQDDLGWRVEIKGREKGRNDYYFFPPGATWGMKNRRDFFDSVPLVVDFIKADPRWKDNPKVIDAINRYERSMEYVETLKNRKKLPKAYDVEWLLKHMDEHSDEKPAGK